MGFPIRHHHALQEDQPSLGDLSNEFHCLSQPILVVLVEAAAEEKPESSETNAPNGACAGQRSVMRQ
jgi:hypothetical protein